MSSLVPTPIGDPRLAPNMKRIRSGSTQCFYRPENRSLQDRDADVRLTPPDRHFYAELIDGAWFWVNGCDECHGREGSWITYIKCVGHDVCYRCKTPRAQLKDIPWGHPKGFECKPCYDARRAIEKTEALAAVDAEGYHEWDYRDLSSPTCPWCKYEYEPCHSHYDADEKVVTCERCETKFELSAETRVEFTSRRIE